jgi:hypothetical protein
MTDIMRPYGPPTAPVRRCPVCERYVWPWLRARHMRRHAELADVARVLRLPWRHT